MGRKAYRDRVRFERPVTTKDAGGGDVGSWQELTTEFCHIERLESFRFDVERQTGGSVGSMPLIRVHVHQNSKTAQIDNSMRGIVLKTGKVLNINFVQDLSSNQRSYVISASEGAAV